MTEINLQTRSMDSLLNDSLFRKGLRREFINGYLRSNGAYLLKDQIGNYINCDPHKSNCHKLSWHEAALINLYVFKYRLALSKAQKIDELTVIMRHAKAYVDIPFHDTFDALDTGDLEPQDVSKDVADKMADYYDTVTEYSMHMWDIKINQHIKG